jgi:hypothetical protein|tara:strand:+ start:264 stop:500 length:237 start_codon:yes stop_codon:yes gene_type:complete
MILSQVILKKNDYQKGAISIVGELNEEQIDNLIKAEVVLSRARIPSIYDVKQRIDVLNDTWDIEWEIDELRGHDGDLI